MINRVGTKFDHLIVLAVPTEPALFVILASLALLHEPAQQIDGGLNDPEIVERGADDFSNAESDQAVKRDRIYYRASVLAKNGIGLLIVVWATQGDMKLHLGVAADGFPKLKAGGSTNIWSHREWHSALTIKILNLMSEFTTALYSIKEGLKAFIALAFINLD